MYVHPSSSTPGELLFRRPSPPSAHAVSLGAGAVMPAGSGSSPSRCAGIFMRPGVMAFAPAPSAGEVEKVPSPERCRPRSVAMDTTSIWLCQSRPLPSGRQIRGFGLYVGFHMFQACPWLSAAVSATVPVFPHHGGGGHKGRGLCPCILWAFCIRFSLSGQIAPVGDYSGISAPAGSLSPGSFHPLSFSPGKRWTVLSLRALWGQGRGPPSPP